MGIKVNKPETETPATVDVSGATVIADSETSTVLQDETEASESTPEAEFSVTYSCHPMQTYKYGPWEFVRGVMTLRSEADVEAFERDLESLPPQERHQIRKVDVDAATALALQHQQMATQAFDSAAGRAALEQLQANNPTVGTKPVDTPAES